MNRFAFIAALFTGFIVSGSACAQWQFSGGPAIRQLRVIETDSTGRDMVQEHGWLPGLAVRADYAMQDWRVGVSGELYRHQITYDGRLQSGVPFSSDTDTTQSRLGIDIARQVTDAVRVIGGVEWDRWQRDILGRGNILGLNERYTSWRLLAGAEMRVLQTAWAQGHAKALLVRAAPEKLRVRFENRLFDDAEVTTQSATGLRAEFSLQPTVTPNMTIATEFDWLRIARSDDAVLRRGGVPAGVVSQAEHSRRAFSIHLNYRF